MMIVAVTTVDLARLQFAMTSLYHFLFVPLTLGLAPLVAIMHTCWYRSGDEAWLRLTRFFGTLMLINFAIGVATGLVQEFQFGMNWSVYSKFVGDVFGAPLAIEGLAAFMLESTFLGLWIFGWDRLSKRVHLATIWLFALGIVGVGLLHHRRQLVDAASGRLRCRQRTSSADEHLGSRLQPARPLGLRARHHGRPDDGRGGHVQRRVLAPPPRPERGSLPQGREARPRSSASRSRHSISGGAATSAS